MSMASSSSTDAIKRYQGSTVHQLTRFLLGIAVLCNAKSPSAVHTARGCKTSPVGYLSGSTEAKLMHTRRQERTTMRPCALLRATKQLQRVALKSKGLSPGVCPSYCSSIASAELSA